MENLLARQIVSDIFTELEGRGFDCGGLLNTEAMLSIPGSHEAELRDEILNACLEHVKKAVTGYKCRHVV